MISINIPIEPVPKGRPRARVQMNRGGKPFAQIYSPASSRSFEKAVGEIVWTHGLAPLEGPLTLKVVFRLRKPKGVKRSLPCVRPDLDNYVKALLDAIEGILFEDDKQVVNIEASKVYAVSPGISLEVAQVEAHGLFSEVPS